MFLSVLPFYFHLIYEPCLPKERGIVELLLVQLADVVQDAVVTPLAVLVVLFEMPPFGPQGPFLMLLPELFL